MLARATWLLAAGVMLAFCGCGRPLPEGQGALPAARPEMVWSGDYEAAVLESKESGKPLMVDVGTDWCVACRRLDETVFSRADVAEASRDFVLVRVNADERRELAKRLSVLSYPTVIFVRPDGDEIERVLGPVPPQVMLEAMARAVAEAGSSGV